MKIQTSLSISLEYSNETRACRVLLQHLEGGQPMYMQHAHPATCNLHTNTTAPGSGCTNNRMQILIERSLQFALDEKLLNLDTHGDPSPTLISRVRR